MKFSRHKAVGVEFQQARWMGSVITPDLIVLHDTASRLEKGNVASYLQNNSVKTSVHFVVERDGTVVQQVPVNRRANHAGRSTYHGRPGCNNFSIGIEIVNPGYMTDAGQGWARTWFGELFENGDYDIERVSTPQHGDHLWMNYTEEQIAAVLDLCEGLFDYIPSLRDVRTHWYVSPGRKVDTNPLFPLDALRARVLGRENPSEDDADDAADGVTGEELITIHAPGDTLNVRRWPSFNPNIVAAIPHGTPVPVIRAGIFDGREWVKVIYGGIEGWIVAAYTDFGERFA